MNENQEIDHTKTLDSKM